MTADELIELWDARDERYGRRRVAGRARPLSPAECELIVSWRHAETSSIPDPAERQRARSVLLLWSAPGVTL